jgi:hypothetical protein
VQIRAHDFNVFIALEMATLLANVPCYESVRNAMCLIGSATFAFIEKVRWSFGDRSASDWWGVGCRCWDSVAPCGWFAPT